MRKSQDTDFLSSMHALFIYLGIAFPYIFYWFQQSLIIKCIFLLALCRQHCTGPKQQLMWRACPPPSYSSLRVHFIRVHLALCLFQAMQLMPNFDTTNQVRTLPLSLITQPWLIAMFEQSSSSSWCVLFINVTGSAMSLCVPLPLSWVCVLR